MMLKSDGQRDYFCGGFTTVDLLAFPGMKGFAFFGPPPLVFAVSFF
jgi:hypothetical protein